MSKIVLDSYLLIENDNIDNKTYEDFGFEVIEVQNNDLVSIVFGYENNNILDIEKNNTEFGNDNL
ncbi:13298_t:CDS:2 [Entrophospora sp. SA101]|nr:13298_t:CDS:2 [Entrophospora sp. SA101]